MLNPMEKPVDKNERELQEALKSADASRAKQKREHPEFFDDQSRLEIPEHWRHEADIKDLNEKRQGGRVD